MLYDHLCESLDRLSIKKEKNEELQQILQTLFDNMDPQHVLEFHNQLAAVHSDRAAHRKPREGELYSHVIKLVAMNVLHQQGNLLFDPPELKISVEDGERLIKGERLWGLLDLNYTGQR